MHGSSLKNNILKFRAILKQSLNEAYNYKYYLKERIVISFTLSSHIKSETAGVLVVKRLHKTNLSRLAVYRELALHVTTDQCVTDRCVLTLVSI